MFIIKDEIKNDVVSYNYNETTKRMEITYTNGKTYPYAYLNVQILKEPKQVDISQYRFTTQNGFILNNICEAYEFISGYRIYLRFFFNNGTFRSYKINDLIISTNALCDNSVNSLFEYFQKAAHSNNLQTDEGEVILRKIYDKIGFIPAESVLASYLNGDTVKNNLKVNNAIFPFGCNLSQISAVKNALSHNISIIEGPPGTGKTQTILNIIANIVMNGKTVMVVSNNNPATDNVFEKLQKYGYDFIAAQMGSSKNKTKFINEKQTPYPDFSDYPVISNDFSLNKKIVETTVKIKTLFEKKNRLAELQRILSDLILEQQYFLDYYNSTFDDISVFKGDKFTSDSLLELWTEIQQIKDLGKNLSFFKKLIYKFKYSITSLDILSGDTEIVVAYIKKLYYEHKISELQKGIDDLISVLKTDDLDGLINKLVNDSEIMFKNRLRLKYDNGNARKIFDEGYWQDPFGFLQEYPVLMSTTFSSRNCFKDMVYDYVIVDEASQVDLVCGALAMSCAKNIVIVGDLKQLPNVITSKDREKLAQISEENNIPTKYRCEEQSLLSSACEVFTDAPRTLLREHYRCHPKIIDFCNKMFYDSQLIIMTKDNGERDVLKAHITVSGNHARGHYNQRQIDEITQVILPELASDDVGIIAPYNAQTNALVKEINEQIPIFTVHKFQGRENDDIIISTVDNKISEFTDDPNMLNVAVSRAKNRLRIVVSDNENNKNTNIGELVRYIQYNNFEVHKSDIYSIFDMLYKGYEQKRKDFLKKHKRVSEYESENLMYALIEDVLREYSFSKLDMISHLPLHNIIRDLHLLNDEEVKYVMNPMTHIDFVIFSRIDKSLLIAIEVDGYAYHKNGTRQHELDEMKNHILEKYKIPYVRFSTAGSDEKNRLVKLINAVLEIE